MPGLVGRDLTVQERLVANLLQASLARHTKAADLSNALSQIAARSPQGFCPAALSLLDSAPDPSVRRKIYQQLVECPEFLKRLMQPDGFTRQQLVEICRELMSIDTTLDVRLARLTPSRWQNEFPLDVESVVLVLDILNEISPGGRLILLLNHLTRHPDRHVASKATLLIGKRLRNQDWVKRQLDSGDERVRANVLEGLWNVGTPSARRCLWNGLKDKNNRVVGNALLGLHQLGERAVFEFVKRMIEDSRPPFRWTAAWVMGKIGGKEFVEPLERALQDEDPQVRRSAERALEAIRPRVPEAAPAPQTQFAPETPPAEVAPPNETPAAAVQPSVPTIEQAEPEKQPAAEDFAFHFDGNYQHQ